MFQGTPVIRLTGKKRYFPNAFNISIQRCVSEFPFHEPVILLTGFPCCLGVCFAEDCCISANC